MWMYIITKQVKELLPKFKQQLTSQLLDFF